MKLEKAVFEFVMPDNTLYSAHWYPCDSENYYAKTPSGKQLNFEVSIFRGGGYKISYYTDHRICEKNSKEFVEKYLKSIQS